MPGRVLLPQVADFARAYPRRRDRCLDSSTTGREPFIDTAGNYMALVYTGRIDELDATPSTGTVGLSGLRAGHNLRGPAVSDGSRHDHQRGKARAASTASNT
jgi:hypothetical protein